MKVKIESEKERFKLTLTYFLTYSFAGHSKKSSNPRRRSHTDQHRRSSESRDWPSPTSACHNASSRSSNHRQHQVPGTSIYTRGEVSQYQINKNLY